MTSSKKKSKEGTYYVPSFHCPQCGNLLVVAKEFKGGVLRSSYKRYVCNNCGHEESRKNGNNLSYLTQVPFSKYKETRNTKESNPYYGSNE